MQDSNSEEKQFVDLHDTNKLFSNVKKRLKLFLIHIMLAITALWIQLCRFTVNKLLHDSWIKILHVLCFHKYRELSSVLFSVKIRFHTTEQTLKKTEVFADKLLKCWDGLSFKFCKLFNAFNLNEIKLNLIFVE